MLGAFISLLDTTIVNVALPDITKSLHASSETIEWVISGYALAFGLILILAGRLGDQYGRKKLVFDRNNAFSHYEHHGRFCNI